MFVRIDNVDKTLLLLLFAVIHVFTVMLFVTKVLSYNKISYFRGYFLFRLSTRLHNLIKFAQLEELFIFLTLCIVVQKLFPKKY